MTHRSTFRVLRLPPLLFAFHSAAFMGCGADGASTGGNGTASGGSRASGGGSAASGGALGATGGSVAAGGTSSASGGAASGGSSSAGSGGTGGVASGGAVGTGGNAAGGAGPVGSGGTSGSGGISGSGGAGGTSIPPLDCGPIGQAIVNAGPPKNRVNYVIVADGYTATTVNSTLQTDIANYIEARFSEPYGQPYLRYKNFVNICLFKSESASDGVSQAGRADPQHPTIFSCYGDDTSRLATCDTRAAQTVLNDNTPAGMSVSWHSIVLNNDKWWNTGSSWMLWSGNHPDGPKGGLHEGGHGFHQLADEYGTCTGARCGSNTMGTGTTGTEYGEINSTGNPATTGDKWDAWIGFDATDATGLQGTWTGSRYVGSGQYRPSANSMMNSLFGNDKNTSFNAVSREQIIFTIWRHVVPIDSTEPPEGPITGPGVLKVNVIDPAVIAVDWTIDGNVRTNAGTTFDTTALTPGEHVISAKAYDNADTNLVRNRSGACPASVKGNYCSRTAWPRSQQTVKWTVSR